MWSFDNIRDLLSANGGVQERTATHFMARCPVHGDGTPSLSVSWVSDPDCVGQTLLHCFGCNAPAADIVAALDPSLTTSILFDAELSEDRRRRFSERVGRSSQQRRAGKRRKAGGRLPALLVKPSQKQELTHSWQEVRRYGYTDPDSGRLVQEVIRQECHRCCNEDGVVVDTRLHKTFKQVYVLADGRRVSRKPPGFRPTLYREQDIRDAIAAGQPVWLLEGEKDADNGAQAGDRTTTNVQGGLNFPRERADVFRGGTVYVVLDRDETGYSRGVQLDEMFAEFDDITVQLLLPATSERKSDYTDHLEAGLRDPDAPYHGFVPITAAEAAAHELAAKLRSDFEGNTVRTVRHARLEAAARMALALDPETDNNELEWQRAQAWAMEAERRLEAMNERLSEVRRFARTASTPWAHEAVQQSENIVAQAKALVRAAYDDARLPVPAPLLEDDEQDPDSSAAQPQPDPVEPPEATAPPAGFVPSAVGEPPAAEEDPDAGRGTLIIKPRYRIMHDRLVEIITKDGVERATQVLSLDARIVELEFLEHEDGDDDVSRPELYGREHLDGSAEANPPAPETLSAVVIGYHNPDTGGEWTLLRIPADAYRDRNAGWLESLPGPPDYDSRPAGLAKVRDALKAAADGHIRRTIRFRSTGWRRDADTGEWFFVHGGGAITSSGSRVAPVLLSGALGRFNLPAPTTDPARLRRAFLDDSGSLLTALPTRVTAPLLGHVFRSALGVNPWVVLLAGSPGSFKTSVASLGMHHWGELWDRRTPATSMSGQGDTLNAMRIKLHNAKDALFWADDVAPTRDWGSAQKLVEEFARLVHNAEGRGRSTRDGQEVLDGTTPRASALVTSEVTPRAGTSGAARTFVVPMQAADIDVKTLKHYDRAESRYGRALVMSTYLQWLAGNLDKARALAAEEMSKVAEDLRTQGGTVRAAEAAGELWSGWAVLSHFLVDVGALAEAEADTLRMVAMSGLLDAVTASIDPDTPATTGARVREMIAHALRTGICYVDDVRTGGRPEWPLAGWLGWRRLPMGEGTDAMMRYESRGTRLGFVLLDPTRRDGGEEQLLIFQSALEQVLKDVAGRMTDAPQVDLATARRALADEGVLITERDGDQSRYTVQRTLHCEGRRTRMIALRLRPVIGADPDPGDGQMGLGDNDPDPRPAPGWGGLSLREMVTGECQGSDVPSEPADDAQEPIVPDDDPQESDMGVSRAPCEGQYEFSLSSEGEAPAQETTPADSAPADVVQEPVNSVPPQPVSERPEKPARVQRQQAPAKRRAASPTPQANSEFRGPLAVLDVDGVWLPDGTQEPLPQPLDHVGHIAQLVDRLRLGFRTNERWVEPGQVWVTARMLEHFGVTLPAPSPDARKLRTDLGEATAGLPFITQALDEGWRLGSPGDRLGPWTRVWHERGGTRAIWIVLETGLLNMERSNPVLGGNPSPATLARRLGLFADALQMPFRLTPQATGFDLMSSTRRDRDVVFKATDLVPPERISACEDDIQWSRVPTDEEMAHRYVHAYDRGGSHLAGFAGLELGIGEAVHHPDGCAFDEKLPGYWRVEVPPSGDRRYPHPLLPLADEKPGLRWVTTPSMKIAIEDGYELEVHEAYVWPHHLRVLDSWYGRVRDARNTLDTEDPDAQLARDLLKAMYTRTIGQMGSELYMRTKVTDPQSGRMIETWRDGFAPHRRHAGIAKARANIMRFVIATGMATDRWPVAITNDTVLYTSNEADPKVAFPGKPAKWGRGLGQYKWEGSALMAEHREFLTGGRYEGKDALIRTRDFVRTERQDMAGSADARGAGE